MSEFYEYRLPGRRTAVWFGLGAAVLLLLLAGIAHAPWFIWAIWSAMAALCLWAVLVNPVSGCRIDGRVWRHYSGRQSGTVPLSEIDEVEILPGGDGPDRVRLHLVDGQVIEPPSLALPPAETLRRVLESLGISVRRG